MRIETPVEYSGPSEENPSRDGTVTCGIMRRESSGLTGNNGGTMATIC